MTPPRAAAAAARLMGDACIALEPEKSRLGLSGDVMLLLVAEGSSDDEVVSPVALPPEEMDKGGLELEEDAVGPCCCC